MMLKKVRFKVGKRTSALFAMCTCGFIAVFHTHFVTLWFTNCDILAFYFSFCFWDDLEKITAMPNNSG